MKTFIIYRLISPSGKSYIGLTSRPFQKRFYQHIERWKAHKGCPKLYSAFTRYHPETWTYEILFNTDIRTLAEQEEIRFIEIFDSVRNGYNVLIGGQVNTLGRTLSEEHKRKIGEAGLGRIVSEETRRKISEKNKGTKPTAYCRQRTIETRIGTTHSEETKKKMSESHKLLTPSEASIKNLSKGKKFVLGHKHTKEAQEKISLALSKRVRNPHTEEAKRKISLAKTGTFPTDEHRQKNSDAVKKWWQLRKGAMILSA